MFLTLLFECWTCNVRWTWCRLRPAVTFIAPIATVIAAITHPQFVKTVAIVACHLVTTTGTTRLIWLVSAVVLSVTLILNVYTPTTAALELVWSTGGWWCGCRDGCCWTKTLIYVWTDSLYSNIRIIDYLLRCKCFAGNAQFYVTQ